NKLSVSHAFPKLAQLEARYGSLIKGQILGARERKKRGEVAKDRAPKFSFDEGLEVLTNTLHDHLRPVVRLNSKVAKITETPEGWVVQAMEDGEEMRAEHSGIVHAGTAFGLAQLNLETEAPISLSSFSEIRYPPVASVVLGFRREDVAH